MQARAEGQVEYQMVRTERMTAQDTGWKPMLHCTTAAPRNRVLQNLA